MRARFVAEPNKTNGCMHAVVLASSCLLVYGQIKRFAQDIIIGNEQVVHASAEVLNIIMLLIVYLLDADAVKE